MVNLSNVSAVETAEKERDSALGKLKAEQRKKEAIEKGHKEEVGKINLKFSNQLKKLKREIDFWRTVSILLIIASISVTYWFIR